MGKAEAPQPPLSRRPNANVTVRILFYTGLTLCSLCILFFTHIAVPGWPWRSRSSSSGFQSSTTCPQASPLIPSISTPELEHMDGYLHSDTFRERSIERLQGAVRIPTESFDDMGKIGEDPRWDVFYAFADYLENTFPLVHETLQLDKVNTHGLLFTWPGTDAALKPTLLMAHQDTVPVEKSTINQWEHAPWSGDYDGTFIWGRGSSDCKNQLVGILEAVETLIEANYQPRRTLLLSFGFDEEISGREGAQSLAQYLYKKFGHHSAAIIVDEGATMAEAWGRDFAMPGVAEKGYVDVDIVVRMPGGHSSIPPEHNGIGVASQLVTLIEANAYQPSLDDQNPYLELLKCGAEYAPTFPQKLKHLLRKRSSNKKTKGKDELAIEASKAGLAVKYLMTTSVAVDIIHGGVKNNALPERTQITVNHRVNVGSSTDNVLRHITSLAGQIATKHNLTLNAFNGTESPSSITLSHRATLLEPAPVTPTKIDGKKSTPYSILAGTTRALYGEELLVAPGIMTGNTDTRYYWNLSEHIFRYGPGWDRDQDGMGSIHTVNERIGVRAHLDTVRWMVGFVRNMDEADI